MHPDLQAQTLNLLTELLEIFNFNRKMVLVNGLLISIVIFNVLMNYMNNRETARIAAQIQALLARMGAEKTARAAAERRPPRTGE